MELGSAQPLPQDPGLLGFGDMEDSVQAESPQQIKVRKRDRIRGLATLFLWGRSAGTSEGPESWEEWPGAEGESRLKPFPGIV